MGTGYRLDYVDLFGDRTVQPMPRPAAGNPEAAWLPDNRSVVMGGADYNADLVRQDVFTGASSTIANTEDGLEPNVAPDGTIVYSSGGVASASEHDRPDQHPGT